jgi:UDP-N-acetylglucosamine 2-epimerase (non-hydrolysing)
VPVAHVEAGLRSHDRTNPFPEETNRCLIGQLATWHFAPTPRAVTNLLEEGHRLDSIEMTGNTVVDSLQWVRDHGLGTSAFRGPAGRRLLVTLHRRETQGTEMLHLSEALGAVAQDLQLEVVLPLHPSPSVRESIIPALGANPNVRLVEPLGYLDFVATLADASLVVTDSGGVLEEAASLSIPTLVARNATERPEAMEANCARLVGTEPDQLRSAVRALFTDPKAHAEMARAASPFGDGHAGLRISNRLMGDLTADCNKILVGD